MNVQIRLINGFEKSTNWRPGDCHATTDSCFAVLSDPSPILGSKEHTKRKTRQYCDTGDLACAYTRLTARGQGNTYYMLRGQMAVTFVSSTWPAISTAKKNWRSFHKNQHLRHTTDALNQHHNYFLKSLNINYNTRTQDININALVKPAILS